MPKLSLFCLLFLFFLPFISSSDKRKDDYNSFVYAGCSLKYTPGSPYQVNVESLLTSLANAAEAS